MDKLSAVMAGAICMVLSISAGIAYTAWGGGSQQFVIPASWQNQIEEELDLAAIAMNDDAQIINGGSEDMWIRAKIQSSDREDLDTAHFRLISDTVRSEPDKDQKQNGVWIPGADDYYYYSQPVSPGEQSKPLFQSIEDHDLDMKGLSIRAEGIQINWIDGSAETGQDAFARFDGQHERQQPVESYKGIST